MSDRAPAGATRAVVIDGRGDVHVMPVEEGVYAAGLDLGVMRFEDASGVLVPVPLPEGDRTAVPDAPEPCPACDAVAWVVDGPRHDGPGTFTRSAFGVRTPTTADSPSSGADGKEVGPMLKRIALLAIASALGFAGVAQGAQTPFTITDTIDFGTGATGVHHHGAVVRVRHVRGRHSRVRRSC